MRSGYRLQGTGYREEIKPSIQHRDLDATYSSDPRFTCLGATKTGATFIKQLQEALEYDKK
jgi:hypothetical protein